MVSFRFHLVTLVAVFVAIALGIAVGATVVDRARTVDLLQERLDRVDARLDETDAENKRQQAALKDLERFGAEAEVRINTGRLEGVTLVLVAVRGTSATAVSTLRASMTSAGGRLLGTLWLEAKFRLGNSDDVGDLAAAAEIVQSTRDATRSAALTKLASGLAGAGPNIVAPLAAAGFIEVEGLADGAPSGAIAPEADTRFVLVSAAEARVPNNELAAPLTTALAEASGRRVVAAETGSNATLAAPAQRADFVGLLRRSGPETARVSTIDNVEDPRGRIATILAVVDLVAPRFGHYGVGPRATSILPPLPVP